MYALHTNFERPLGHLGVSSWSLGRTRTFRRSPSDFAKTPRQAWWMGQLADDPTPIIGVDQDVSEMGNDPLADIQ